MRLKNVLEENDFMTIIKSSFSFWGTITTQAYLNDGHTPTSQDDFHFTALVPSKSHVSATAKHSRNVEPV